MTNQNLDTTEKKKDPRKSNPLREAIFDAHYKLGEIKLTSLKSMSDEDKKRLFGAVDILEETLKTL